MDYLYAYLVSLITMTILDAAWLALIAPSFYKQHIGYIMSGSPNLLAAALFYGIYIVGLTVFVVYPAWKQHYSALKILFLGGLLGLVAYATYDLTNLATLKDWPVIVTVVDLVWGTLLTGLVALVSVAALRKLFAGRGRSS